MKMLLTMLWDQVQGSLHTDLWTDRFESLEMKLVSFSKLAICFHSKSSIKKDFHLVQSVFSIVCWNEIVELWNTGSPLSIVQRMVINLEFCCTVSTKYLNSSVLQYIYLLCTVKTWSALKYYTVYCLRDIGRSSPQFCLMIRANQSGSFELWCKCDTSNCLHISAHIQVLAFKSRLKKFKSSFNLFPFVFAVLPHL